MRYEKYAIWPIFMAESPKFLHLSEIGVGTHVTASTRHSSEFLHVHVVTLQFHV